MPPLLIGMAYVGGLLFSEQNLSVLYKIQDAFLLKILRTNFLKTLDKYKLLFYNIIQNKRVERTCTETYVQRERTIFMTTSTARKIEPQTREIVMTVCKKKDNLAVQKLAGLAMLALIGFALLSGTEFAALAIVSPMALAAVFSKEKVLDFGIFAITKPTAQPRKFSPKTVQEKR